MKEYTQTQNDIAISSRVRLARNLAKVPMPHINSKQGAMQAKEEILSAVSAFGSNKTIELESAPAELKSSLVERHLTSKEFGQNPHGAFAMIDDMRSVMINEEDHIRLQVIVPGFNLEDAYLLAKETDEVLGEKLPYAFDKQLGYLTSCPTNLGTAMRASVMVHLPALSMTERMGSIVATCAKFGLTLRGIYGEGSKALGDLYQISNQNSLGLSEREIIQNVHTVTRGIIKNERAQREWLLENKALELADGIWRAYGTLSNCRIISSAEAMKHLSLLKMGIDLKIIPDIQGKTIDNLIVNIQPYTLSLMLKEELDTMHRDEARASMIRSTLKGSEQE